MIPDWEQSDLGPYCLQYMLLKNIRRESRRQMRRLVLTPEKSSQVGVNLKTDYSFHKNWFSLEINIRTI